MKPGAAAVAPVLIAVFGQKRGGPKPGDDKKNYYVTESVGIACGLEVSHVPDEVADFRTIEFVKKFIADLGVKGSPLRRPVFDGR